MTNTETALDAMEGVVFGQGILLGRLWAEGVLTGSDIRAVWEHVRQDVGPLAEPRLVAFLDGYEVGAAMSEHPYGWTDGNRPIAKAPSADYFLLEYPALTGEMVKQGHVDACRKHGHGFNRLAGIEQGWCPRCGEPNGKS